MKRSVALLGTDNFETRTLQRYAKLAKTQGTCCYWVDKIKTQIYPSKSTLIVLITRQKNLAVQK